MYVYVEYESRGEVGIYREDGGGGVERMGEWLNHNVTCDH